MKREGSADDFVTTRCWGEEAETEDDFCHGLERGEALCRERVKRMNCLGIQEQKMVMFLERGRQV